MLEKINELVARVRKATPELAEVRASARAPVFDVVSRIEDAIVDALNGERLRAYTISRPLSHGASVLKGFRITGRFPGALLPIGEPHIVLRDDGRFIIATRDAEGGLEVQPLQPDQLRAEHLEAIVDRVQHALEYHLARVELTSATYRRAEDLAKRLASVF